MFAATHTLSTRKSWAKWLNLVIGAPVVVVTDHAQESTWEPVKPTRRYRLGAYDHPSYLPPVLPALTTARLTAQAREVIRMVRDVVRRERAAQASTYAIAKEYRGMHRPEGWLIDGTETRVNPRGATGIRGVKGMAERVSMRDAHGPVEILRELPTVGIATHVDASHSDYAYLIQECRKSPSLCSYKRLMPGPHGRMNCGIVPVIELAQERYERRAARKRGETRAPVQPDVLRYAPVVGYIGNVI